MMQAYQYQMTGVVEVDVVFLAPSLEIRALLDDCGGKVRVEETLECRVTYPQRLDG